MFSFSRKKNPTNVHVRSAEEAQQLMRLASEKGERFTMKMKEEDFASMGDFFLSMIQESSLGRNAPCPCSNGKNIEGAASGIDQSLSKKLALSSFLARPL